MKISSNVTSFFRIILVERLYYLFNDSVSFRRNLLEILPANWTRHIAQMLAQAAHQVMLITRVHFIIGPRYVVANGAFKFLPDTILNLVGLAFRSFF